MKRIKTITCRDCNHKFKADYRTRYCVSCAKKRTLSNMRRKNQNRCKTRRNINCVICQNKLSRYRRKYCSSCAKRQYKKILDCVVCGGKLPKNKQKYCSPCGEKVIADRYSEDLKILREVHDHRRKMIRNNPAILEELRKKIMKE